MKTPSQKLRESMDLVERPLVIGGARGTTRADREVLRKNYRDTNAAVSAATKEKLKGRVQDNNLDDLPMSVFNGPISISPEILSEYFENMDPVPVEEYISNSRIIKSPLINRDNNKQVFLDAIMKSSQYKGLVNNLLSVITERKPVDKAQIDIRRFFISAEKQFENKLLANIQRK